MSKKQAFRSRGRGRYISISQTTFISPSSTSSSDRISSQCDSPSLIIQDKKYRVLMLFEIPICHGHAAKIVTFATATSLRSQHDTRVSATTSTSSLRCIALKYYVHVDYTTLVLRPSRPYCALTAFQVRSPNLGVCFEHS